VFLDPDSEGFSTGNQHTQSRSDEMRSYYERYESGVAVLPDSRTAVSNAVAG